MGVMTKKVMKRLVLMIMVVLAIHVQAMVKASNPYFSYLSPNHAPSLTHFLHSQPIIYLSPQQDANQSQRNHSPRKTTPKKRKIPSSKLTKEERKCLDECTKLIKNEVLHGFVLKLLYTVCIRNCLGYTLPWIWPPRLDVVKSPTLLSFSLYCLLSFNF